MKTMFIETKASQFESTGEILVSWDVHGWSSDDEDQTHNWQFQSMVIATIAEAEAFSAKLAAVIVEAKARRDEFYPVAPAIEPTAEDGEIKADK